MKNCKEIRLSEQGTAYIRECLENGKNLGKQLLPLIDRERGQVTALLPGDVDSERLSELISEFRYGGISSIGGTLTCLTKMLQEFFAVDSSHVCIIEDTIAQRGDGWIASFDGPVLFLGSDVYYFLSSKHRDDLDKIRRILATLDSMRVTGVLTSWPAGRDSLSEKQELTLKDVKDLAERAQIVVADAYDGEGYVFWRRA